MKQSPYFRINYGWPYGTDGWNTGMDESLLTLSFLAAHQVISIVSQLPETASEGDAYVLSSDNSARFFVDGTWKIVYPEDGWEFKTSQDGFMYIFKDGVPVQKVDPDDLSVAVGELVDRVDNIDTRLEGVDTSLSNLSDIPDRVSALEGDTVSQEELQTLTVRVDSLETQDSATDQRITGVELDVGTLEESISLMRDDIDQKIDSVVGGDGISVDNTDPTDPLVSVDLDFFSPVATTGSYNDLIDTPTLGSAASEDVASFDPAGTAEGVNTTLTTLINGRMSSAARDVVNLLDPTTATLEDLITALQLT